MFETLTKLEAHNLYGMLTAARDDIVKADAKHSRWDVKVHQWYTGPYDEIADLRRDVIQDQYRNGNITMDNVNEWAHVPFGWGAPNV